MAALVCDVAPDATQQRWKDKREASKKNTHAVRKQEHVAQVLLSRSPTSFVHIFCHVPNKLSYSLLGAQVTLRDGYS